jgi:hypothetical protein
VIVSTVTCLAPGCTPAQRSPDEPGATVEFVYVRSGGLCASPEGGGAPCRLTVVVRDDGTWSVDGSAGTAPGGGLVPPGSASELTAILDEGWQALTAVPFRGLCPTAYDGSEVSYTVRHVPSGPSASLADAEVREVRSCTYDLGHPEARAVLDRLSEAWSALDLPG